MNREEFFIQLVRMAEKINIQITEEQADKFYDYMNLLLQWNTKINLTAIVEPKDIILKHFIDSITINKYIKKDNCIMDIGTGAGFPAIPLKILNTNESFTLVDSLNKRINFLNEVCDSLLLNNIECLHFRAEELAVNDEYRERYDVVTSRAVARLSTLLEYTMPFVKVGGICVCMKGANIEEELIEAKKAIQVLGGKIEQEESFKLPDSDIERNNIIIKKIKSTPVQYPRRAGKPLKQPIM